MFGINQDIESFQFTNKQKKEISDSYDTGLLITNRDEFFRRIAIATKKSGFEEYHGFISYYDEDTISINMLASLFKGMENIAFWKRDKFSYQQEFRFLIHMAETSKDYIELNIGDISDISVVMKSSTILNSMVEQHNSENG